MTQDTPPLTRLILFIDVAMMQATVVKGSPAIGQRVKQVFNQFFAHGRTLTRQLLAYLNRTNQSEEYDNQAAIVFEAMDELFKCEDKVKAVALLRALNEGNVTIEDNF